MELGAAIWIFSIILGTAVGSTKGEGCVSFIWCIILGPFWLPIVFLSKGSRVKCPYCQERIDKKAIVCPHCQKDLVNEK